MATSSLLLPLRRQLPLLLVLVLAIASAAARPATMLPPCPAVACKDHLGRTHCPGKPEQCQRASHAGCAPCSAPQAHHVLACQPPHDTYPFCDASLSLPDRVRDLIGRINDTDKPGLLTARGGVGLPYLGIPAYYWCARAACTQCLWCAARSDAR